MLSNMLYLINLLIARKEFCLLLWLTWESLLQFFIKLITSFSYLHSWWMKVAHCTLPWCLWHESFYGTHTNVPDHVVPWWGSKSHPQHQSPEAFLLFCKSQPLLPVGQGQNIVSPIPYALRKNSPLPLKFQKVTSVVTVFVSGLTHWIPKHDTRVPL